MHFQPFILASASPQRRQLLRGLGADCAVIPSGVDESVHPEMQPARRASTLAALKAEDVRSRYPGKFVLGADTLVEAHDGSLLEKAADEASARAMLLLQSATSSIVHSALCLIDPAGQRFAGLSSSSVLFRVLTQRDLDWWMGTDLWRERSGSFQIDGPGQMLIERIEGDWTGIVGLPVFLFGQLAEAAGLLAHPPSAHSDAKR